MIEIPTTELIIIPAYQLVADILISFVVGVFFGLRIHIKKTILKQEK